MHTTRIKSIIVFSLFSSMLAIDVRAQSAETQIRTARTASNEAIARHDADGIVRDMLADYSIVTGKGQHVQGKDTLRALTTRWRGRRDFGQPNIVIAKVAIIQPCGADREIPGNWHRSCSWR